MHEILKKGTSMNYLLIEGIKNCMNLQSLECIERMPHLLQYRVYYDNVDLVSELNSERNKALEKKCLTRTNALYALAKNEKFKYMESKRMSEILREFLLWFDKLVI